MMEEAPPVLIPLVSPTWELVQEMGMIPAAAALMIFLDQVREIHHQQDLRIQWSFPPRTREQNPLNFLRAAP
jgi:hypothetical protein